MEKYILLFVRFIRNILTTIWWFFKQLISENFKTYFDEIEHNKPLYILGNGPSLKNELNHFDNKNDFFVVNNFNQDDLFFYLKPKYYLIVDPLYFDIKLMTEKERETIKLLTCVCWEMILFIPFKYYKSFCKTNGQLVNNNKIKIIPFHTNPYIGFNKIKFFLFSKGLSSPQCANVLIPSILNGINLGYKVIYLYGADHSWISLLRVNNKNQLCLTDSHFYDAVEKKSIPWINVEGKQVRMHEALFAFSKMFKGYWELKLYSQKRKCMIINKTDESYIDAFDRLIDL